MCKNSPGAEREPGRERKLHQASPLLVHELFRCRFVLKGGAEEHSKTTPHCRPEAGRTTVPPQPWGSHSRRAVALPFCALHSSAAGPRTGRPGAPGRPAAVDGLGAVSHVHTLAIEAPLWGGGNRSQASQGGQALRHGQWGQAACSAPAPRWMTAKKGRPESHKLARHFPATPHTPDGNMVIFAESQKAWPVGPLKNTHTHTLKRQALVP